MDRAPAGNQFSVPLIDFMSDADAAIIGWESVLRPPDRLPPAPHWKYAQLGISSPSP